MMCSHIPVGRSSQPDIAAKLLVLYLALRPRCAVSTSFGTISIHGPFGEPPMGQYCPFIG